MTPSGRILKGVEQGCRISIMDKIMLDSKLAIQVLKMSRTNDLVIAVASANVDI
jgi:hypothetical protein